MFWIQKITIINIALVKEEVGHTWRIYSPTSSIARFIETFPYLSPNFFLYSHELLGYWGTLYASINSSQTDDKENLPVTVWLPSSHCLSLGLSYSHLQRSLTVPNDFLRSFWISLRKGHYKMVPAPQPTMTTSWLLLDKNVTLSDFLESLPPHLVPTQRKKIYIYFFGPKKGEWDLSQQIAAAKLF